MKKLQTILSVGALAASSVLFSNIACAQTAATKDPSQGSLGKRYAFVDFATGKPKGATDNIYGSGIGVNMPLTEFLDISGGYGYSRQKTRYSMAYGTFTSSSHVLGADFVAYKKAAGGLKPFVAASLGYSWVRAEADFNIPNFGSWHSEARNDFATWGVSTGVEIPFRWVALTPVISYADDFEKSNNSTQTWSYGLEASSWITPRVGVYADVAYTEPKHYDGHMWSYGAGLRIKF